MADFVASLSVFVMGEDLVRCGRNTGIPPLRPRCCEALAKKEKMGVGMKKAPRLER